MELLPGSLPDLLRQIRPFSLPMTCMRKLAFQLLVSLSFLSSQGVIHADIRPENVTTPARLLARDARRLRMQSFARQARLIHLGVTRC